MRMVTQTGRPDVDILGLGWEHIAFLMTVLGKVEREHGNARWRELAGELGDLFDAGTQTQLNAYLESTDGQTRSDNL